MSDGRLGLLERRHVQGDQVLDAGGGGAEARLRPPGEMLITAEGLSFQTLSP